MVELFVTQAQEAKKLNKSFRKDAHRIESNYSNIELERCILLLGNHLIAIKKRFDAKANRTVDSELTVLPDAALGELIYEIFFHN